MALLLVPGFMTDADLWRDVAGGLQAFGPVVHADLGRDDSIPAMARRALEGAAASCILVGFSMGGYVARDIARLAPDRVQALVLIATSARGDTAAQVQRKARAASRLGVASAVSLSRSDIASSLHPGSASDAALIDRIQAMGARLGPEVFRRQLVLNREGDVDRLHEIRAPSLVIAGAQDRLRSVSEAVELREGIAGSAFTIIEGAGHMIPMEAPARLVEEIVSWLRETVDVSRTEGPT